MKKLIIILCCLVLVSCATTKKKQQGCVEFDRGDGAFILWCSDEISFEVVPDSMTTLKK